MADKMAEKLAEAKKKMFGAQQPSGKVIILVKGDALIKSTDPKVEVRKQE
ncbi:unnamed protein product [marine sediment metagenome]|uniref:Uncharacterized protein n=1 Tax=marine sediment metagenome TaxID=412755 RepID=X1PLL7_9ZZZZ